MASDTSEDTLQQVDPNTGQPLQAQQFHAFQGYPGSSPGQVPPSVVALESSQTTSYGLQPLSAVTSQSIIQEPIGGTSTTLAVTNLPYRIRWQDLKDLFRRYGTPSRADVFLAPDGRSRGVGMVTMRTRGEAENCVNDLNGYEWYGRKIGVRIDETGGHHALAAAAMAGATIWEGVGIQEYEVRAPDPSIFFCA
jgi:hypothetical protein